MINKLFFGYSAVKRFLNIEHRIMKSLLPAIARHTQFSSFFCCLAQARRAGRSVSL